MKNLRLKKYIQEYVFRDFDVNLFILQLETMQANLLHGECCVHS